MTRGRSSRRQENLNMASKRRRAAARKRVATHRWPQPTMEEMFGRKKKTIQKGGFLPGLIIGALKAKLKKKKFDAGKYMKGAIGRRVDVAKVAAGRQVPTPGNTGMTVKKFFTSGLFGIG